MYYEKKKRKKMYHEKKKIIPEEMTYILYLERWRPMYQALRNILSKKRKWFTWRCFRELDPKLNRKITALNICRHSAACLFVCFNLAILFFEHENCGVFR